MLLLSFCAAYQWVIVWRDIHGVKIEGVKSVPIIRADKKMLHFFPVDNATCAERRMRLQLRGFIKPGGNQDVAYSVSDDDLKRILFRTFYIWQPTGR